MKERIKERYTQSILKEAMQRYGISDDRIRLLDGFESFIYEFERGGRDYILRVGHSLRRSVSLIRGELDWINYLAKGGASVAAGIRSRQGSLVEPIDDGQGGQFLASAFEKAKGTSPRSGEWTPPLIERYGGLLGRMHALSKHYRPPQAEWKRPQWNDPEMLEVERVLPPAEEPVLERFNELMERLQGLERDGESYGLIHQDAHGGNLFIDQAGQITLFDFDDCAYSWYMNDIAIVLFYAAMWEEDPAGFTHQFMSHFLRGYSRENRLDPVWLREIPHFLKLREIDLYAVIHRSFDVENLQDPWCAGYMRGRRERLKDGVPYIDFKFETLTEFLTGD